MLWRFWTMARAAYWALFDPRTPLSYAANVVVRPTMNVLIFGFLARNVASDEQVRRVVVGAAFLTLNWSVVSATLQTIGNELANGTLGLTIASPTPRAALLASRGLLHVPNGLLTALAASLVGGLMFRIDVTSANWVGVAGSAVLVAVSLTCLGLLAGVVSLALREVWALLGACGLLLYLFSGAIVPLESLHPVVEGIGSVVPGRWGVAGLQGAIAGSSTTATLTDWWRELLVALGYFTLAVIALSWFERRARRQGSVDLI